MRRESKATRRWGRRYFVELGLVMLLYMGALFVCLPAARAEADPLLRIVLALTPMLPAALTALVIVRHAYRVDEYARRQLGEGIAFAAGCTALFTIGYGFLESIGYPRQSMWLVWPVMAGSWLLWLPISALRGRCARG